MPEPEEAKQSADVPYYWSETDRLVAATYRGYLAASPIADSFSNWSLGFAGVGYSVVLSQYSSLPSNLQVALLAAMWWFVGAGVFAVAAKVCSLAVAGAAGGSEAVVRQVNALRNEGLLKVDWDEADAALVRPLRWPLSKLVIRLKEKGVDNLHGLRFAVQVMQVQAWAVSLQLLALLGALVVFTWQALCPAV